MTVILEFGTTLPTALYRFYAAGGRLLYIGITDDLRARLAAHEARKSWWPEVRRTTVEWHTTRQEALAAEAAAIRAECPVHNITHAVPAKPLPAWLRDPGDPDDEFALAVAMRMTAAFLGSFAREVAPHIDRSAAQTVTRLADSKISAFEEAVAQITTRIEPVFGPVDLPPELLLPGERAAA